MTWNELRDYARQNYPVASEAQDHFSIIVRFEDGRYQEILIRSFNAFDQEWIEYRSLVCKEHELDPKVALRRNAALPMGALALDAQGTYFLVYNLALATLDIESFTLPLNVLVSIADDLEKTFAKEDRF